MDQRIKLNLHKYKTAGMQQFNIDRLSDDDDADDYDDQSSLSSVSDDEFSESESSYQDTTGSTGPSEATTDEMQWERYVFFV
ncbi:hypothetical protein CAEBREN_11296 [Caenorhabditis brenneri]|uniref:Uncharacterized protein n=1 Tax=Caenorhabditis brenneri TaxID=135651 RepID=G0M7P6_CAEBE|nr:hypothetical protein CAEBREN_11296 [Caenorhabditis brenneri]